MSDSFSRARGARRNTERVVEALDRCPADPQGSPFAPTVDSAAVATCR